MMLNRQVRMGASDAGISIYDKSQMMLLVINLNILYTAMYI